MSSLRETAQITLEVPQTLGIVGECAGEFRIILRIRKHARRAVREPRVAVSRQGVVASVHVDEKLSGKFRRVGRLEGRGALRVGVERVLVELGRVDDLLRVHVEFRVQSVLHHHDVRRSLDEGGPRTRQSRINLHVRYARTVGRARVDAETKTRGVRVKPVVFGGVELFQDPFEHRTQVRATLLVGGEPLGSLEQIVEITLREIPSENVSTPIRGLDGDVRRRRLVEVPARDDLTRGASLLVDGFRVAEGIFTRGHASRGAGVAERLRNLGDRGLPRPIFEHSGFDVGANLLHRRAQRLIRRLVESDFEIRILGAPATEQVQVHALIDDTLTQNPFERTHGIRIAGALVPVHCSAFRFLELHLEMRENSSRGAEEPRLLKLDHRIQDAALSRPLHLDDAIPLARRGIGGSAFAILGEGSRHLVVHFHRVVEDGGVVRVGLARDVPRALRGARRRVVRLTRQIRP